MQLPNPIDENRTPEDGVWRFWDSPEIRTALNKRLQDPYEDARREAIWGLARRKDILGLKLLLGHLESESWWGSDEYTAKEVLNLAGNTPVEDLRLGLRRLLTKNLEANAGS